jgi:3-hydroxyacyl-[acyl-carrier-protein] dehydratase
MNTSDNLFPVVQKDINAIMALLPHRYPFLLIDRVLEVERKQRNVARTRVTSTEEFVQGHFPGYPIMPAVLQVEAIAQAGGILVLLDSERPSDTLMLFTGVERAKFRRPVVPGDVLEIEAKILNLRSRAVRLDGYIRVDGKLVCEAQVTCMLVQRKADSGIPAPGGAPTGLADAPVPGESQAVTTE